MDAKHALLRRRQRALQQVPPLDQIVRGSLVERAIRCGKPRCRCATGAGHPTVYLTVSFARGRTEQVTVPPALVPVVRRWLANDHALWGALEEIAAANRELLRKRWLDADPDQPGG
jgi:hypothetical protein